MIYVGQIYRHFKATGEIPKDLWTEWLWRTDPEEPLHASVLMNKSQLMGLLLALHQNRKNSAAAAPVRARADVDPNARIRLMDKRPADMTLKELVDTVDNICIEWPSYVKVNGAKAAIDCVLPMVDECMGRFGWMAYEAHPPEVMDDLSHTEMSDSSNELSKLTLASVRRFTGKFLILYRHFHLIINCQTVPDPPSDAISKLIYRHHMEASNDDFHILCMHMLLPVSARLGYKLEFPGMYNHISQVIYFHNPQYERQRRIPVDDVPKGDPMQVLPAIQQIHPEIPMMLEEEPLDISSPIRKWVWLVVAGRIYLISPESVIYHHENIMALLHFYRDTAGAAVNPSPSG